MLSLNLNKIRTRAGALRAGLPARGSSARTDDFRVAAPVSLVFDIFKDKQTSSASSARVQTTLELPCSRCLEPFTLPVDAEFDLRYQPHSQNTGEGSARSKRTI